MQKLYIVAYNPNISSNSEILIQSKIEPISWNEVSKIYPIEECIEVVINIEDKKYIERLKTDFKVNYLDL
jgi:hypothetical protein